MTQSGFIVVIDLGTSKITGVIGRKNDNGVISILHHVTLPSEDSIRRGAIYNIGKAGSIVSKLVKMLEHKMDASIGKVFVSLGGRSLYTTLLREEMTLAAENGIVTNEIIDKLNASAKNYQPDLKSNYDIADVEYFLDDKSEKSPIGVASENIKAIFRIVVGRPNLITNIQKVIEKTNVEIADYIISSTAAADIVLTDEEKDLGCAFVDFGAGTTDVVVYKGGILRHMVTIPFGGKNITRDITELNFVESDAEQYKVKFGKAKESNEGFTFSSPFSSKPDIDLVELNKVIVLRLDEITANIKEQIKLSEYGDELGAGIVITGGASQLKNLDLYLSQKLGMPVRKATARKTFVNNAPELVSSPSMSSLLGMLLKANENCEYIPPKVIVVEEEHEEATEDTETPRTPRSTPKGNRGWGGIFGKDPKEKKSKNDSTPNKTPDKKGKLGDAMKDMFIGFFDDSEDDR